MTERLVTIPESTAALIRKVFLPANPNKLRNRPGLQGDQLEQVRKACHDFIAAIEAAQDQAVDPLDDFNYVGSRHHY